MKISLPNYGCGCKITVNSVVKEVYLSCLLFENKIPGVSLEPDAQKVLIRTLSRLSLLALSWCHKRNKSHGPMPPDISLNKYDSLGLRFQS